MPPPSPHHAPKGWAAPDFTGRARFSHFLFVLISQGHGGQARWFHSPLPPRGSCAERHARACVFQETWHPPGLGATSPVMWQGPSCSPGRAAWSQHLSCCVSRERRRDRPAGCGPSGSTARSPLASAAASPSGCVRPGTVGICWTSRGPLRGPSCSGATPAPLLGTAARRAGAGAHGRPPALAAGPHVQRPCLDAWKGAQGSVRLAGGWAPGPRSKAPRWRPADSGAPSSKRGCRQRARRPSSPQCRLGLPCGVNNEGWWASGGVGCPQGAGASAQFLSVPASTTKAKTAIRAEPRLLRAEPHPLRAESQLLGAESQLLRAESVSGCHSGEAVASSAPPQRGPLWRTR